MTDVATLDSRITRLEGQIAAGLDRIERMLRTEITDLKTEQINDLREANKRLADDQRRAWEAIERLRGSDDRRTGGNKAFDRLWNVVSGVVGAVAVLAGSWLTTGRHP